MTIATSYENVTYNSPDGALIGSSASELIGFHGKTPCDQAAFVATVANSALTGGVGFSSTAAFSNAVVLLNALQTLLVEKGLMAAS